MNIFGNLYKDRDLNNFKEQNCTIYYKDEYPSMRFEFPNNWTHCYFERVKNINTVLSSYDIVETIEVAVGTILTGTDKTIIEAGALDFTPGLWQMKLDTASGSDRGETYITDIYKIIDENV